MTEKKKLLSHIKKFKLPQLEDNCEAQCFMGNGICVVYIYKTTDIVDTLVHEAVHIWQHTVDFIGEENPGDEMEAYTIAFITSSLLKEYNRLKDKGNNYSLHDQRKARLQEAERAVQLQASTSEGSGGAEQRTASSP
jgi:hypothetical protein